MQLTLLVTDLLWPEQALRDTVFDLHLPALETLLGKAVAERCLCVDSSDWLLQRFGLAHTENRFPAAALRLRGLTGMNGDGEWLCVDLVSLNTAQQEISLDDPSTIQISAEENAELLALLGPWLRETGELEASIAGRWHLRPNLALPADETVFPCQLSKLIARPAHLLLPAAAAGRPWRVLQNELQMSLHEHPINQARRTAGKPLINGVAFWGYGALPAAPSLGITAYDSLDSPRGEQAGIAALAGLSLGEPHSRYSAVPGHQLVVLDELLLASQQHDAMHWRHGLETLEENWIAPAMAAWKAGKLDQLHVIGFGDKEALSLSLGRNARWKFWAQAAPLTRLYA